MTDEEKQIQDLRDCWASLEIAQKEKHYWSEQAKILKDARRKMIEELPFDQVVEKMGWRNFKKERKWERSGLYLFGRNEFFLEVDENAHTFRLTCLGRLTPFSDHLKQMMDEGSWKTMEDAQKLIIRFLKLQSFT